ncbi:plastocyanin/azurin family copper-binding protein [uncultured Roseibium sp.]|uniref:plastocyanin/azurin family copper-binding protein n=1 Tax=uncultured Roseibium sp. TaxID=1936171 RepID=UPI002609D31B|nr:plastocyanin/azurin family copper-binding protein [uncultured Roseibium sp.]
MSVFPVKVATSVLVSMLLFGTAFAQTCVPNEDIDQITDPAAETVLDMFRFEPDFVALPLGGRVTFNNSRGQHTVHSMKGLIPEGVEAISIANTASETRTMDVPGLYVLSCKVHGRYGMVMLIAVGEREAWKNPPGSWTKKMPGRAGEKLDLLLKKLDGTIPR